MTAAIASVRTPDDQFEGLSGYDFEPHYIDPLPGGTGLRMHYLDEGPKDAEHTFLCLHGEPTWSYLYRKMIPVFVESGARVVAPDFFGFGRSDKPTEDDTYTFDFHLDSLAAFIEHLGLKNVTLVCQDWGGLLGLTLPIRVPGLVSRLVIMNTALGVALGPVTKGFAEWRDYVKNTPDFDVAKLMRRSVPGITDAEAAAYEAPFVDASYKAGVRTFPAIVPVTPEMGGVEISRKAASFWSTQWDGPTFMAVGEQDPVLGPKVMKMVRGMIRGCPDPLMLPHAGHFVQECGDEVARAALAAFAAS